MIDLTNREIEKILSLHDVVDFSFNGIKHDTRQDLVGSIYAAVIGESLDGHDYCQSAKDKGAVALLLDHKVDVDLPQIIVKDTLIALGKLAAYWRKQCDVDLIALTGSNGKTSVKNLLSSILCAAVGEDKVLYNLGNYNNHIGMPLTLCRLNKQHQYAVIEMGMNHFGELEYLSNLAEPEIACINNVFAVHAEGVGDIDGVAKAKCEIFSGLDKDGIVVLNADNSHFDYCKKQAQAYHIKTFGVDQAADVGASEIQLLPQASKFMLHCSVGDINIDLSMPGKHYILNALAAASCALAVGIDLESIKQGLAVAKLEKNRLNFASGLNDVLIIDDCYNANPESLIQSVKVLMQQPGRKILVMGDLGELGVDAEKIHTELGEKIKKIGVEYLFACGPLTKHTCAGFKENAFYFDDKQQLIAELKQYCDSNTVVLIKASLSMAFAKIVDQLQATL